MSSEALARAYVTDYGLLHERFAPVFADIAQSSAIREQDRILPFDEVRALKDAGFLGVRVPVEFGGSGASVTDLFRLLIDLGAADPNVTQIFRSHFGFVEGRLISPHRDLAGRWLRRAGHALIGNASSEAGTASTMSIVTALNDRDGGLTVSGTKFYSTGTLFADYVIVFAVRGEGFATAVLPRGRAGITIVDDWHGLGQRLTGSGTTIFDQVTVEDDDLLPRENPSLSYQFPFFQLELLAALAGIARQVRDDAAAVVRGQQRTFGYRPGRAPREDPLLQGVIGELATLATVAEATVLHAAAEIERTYQRCRTGRALVGDFQRVAVAVSNAQVVVTRATLRSCRRFYDVGGGSLTAAGRNFDRHWRNARTIASHNPSFYRARAVGDNVLNLAPVPLTP